MYTMLQAILKTRRFLKDNTETVWTNADIKDFVNEGAMAVKRTIPEYFTDLVEVFADGDTIQLEDEYKMLPCIYAASRCFEQDEQHYRATTKRNEFEALLLDMETQILGSIKYYDKINDPDNPYYQNTAMDYVRDVYYVVEEDDELLPLNP